MDIGWCVVISKPMAEHVAAKSIRQAGYREYLPMEQRILKGHRESKGTPKLYPLFPRYLFAELHPDQGWTPILRATGVQDIIKRGERPALLSPGVVEAIRDAEDAGEFNERKPDALQAGMTVRVEAGPFASLIGKIVLATSERKIVVLLDVMGGTKATMRAQELTVVCP